MQSRVKIAFLLLLLILALVTPQLSHADTMGWEFTFSRVQFTSSTTWVYLDTQSFFISVWDTPSSASNFIGNPNGPLDVISFTDIPGLSVVRFFPDGTVTVGSIEYLLTDGGGLQLWTGDPYHPQFITGNDYPVNELAQGVYDIEAVNAPEPSTICLFGTGVLGIIGAARRKFKPSASSMAG